MSGRTESIRAVEALILRHAQTEPFHTIQPSEGLPGGSCSDRARAFVRAGQAAGFEVELQSGVIPPSHGHRLARVLLQGRLFFAEVGDAWPALRLYPADRAVEFRRFSMRFRTEVLGDKLSVFHQRPGKPEQLQLHIDIPGKSEEEILQDIAQRRYPFPGHRFAQVLGDRFLFLREDAPRSARLQIYSSTGLQTVDQSGRALADILREHFDCPPALVEAAAEHEARHRPLGRGHIGAAGVKRPPMSTLKELLCDSDQRDAVVRDTTQLIASEVKSKSGISGMAIKAGYKAVNAIKPSLVPDAVDSLLDRFVDKVEPFYASWVEAGKTPGFEAFLSGRSSEAANALLAVTDERAEQADPKLRKIYQKLRPQGEKNVQAAIPGLGRLVAKYV